jgi:beta-lactamase class C
MQQQRRLFTGTHLALWVAIFTAVGVALHHKDDASRSGTAVAAKSIRGVVDAAVRPLMTKEHIPGMAVGIAAGGRVYVFNYGVASLASRKPVTGNTLFEIGSVSKTFTTTLASWAHVKNRLSLSDKTAKYLPQLRGTPFGNVALVNLGTHTPGGLPLQVPDGIDNDRQLMRYFKQWRPAYQPGTYRTYSNPGIGMLGFITAKALNEDFATLMQRDLFPALGLQNTFIDIPNEKAANYAQGYTRDGTPIRMARGELSAEAYGITSTAADLARFLQANMNELKLDAAVQQALTNTHTGYFKAGPLTQDLIWEQYRYPVALQTLLQGNSDKMIYEPARATAIVPPQKPQNDAWINKTGSTNGFSAYVAFVPEKRLGIVILANKNYPINERVTAAYAIATALGK